MIFISLTKSPKLRYRDNVYTQYTISWPTFTKFNGRSEKNKINKGSCCKDKDNESSFTFNSIVNMLHKDPR